MKEHSEIVQCPPFPEGETEGHISDLPKDSEDGGT